LDNLQVLKESISDHKSIRIHLAVLFHKNEHLILLPWAHHFDLDIFLLEGHTFQGDEMYDFNLRFPKIQPGMMMEGVCTQMFHIADALEWLHKGVIVPAHPNRIHFAHMDMKPNNILIDEDGLSTVGKWVLTDFGISAFMKDDEPVLSDLLSIRDLYENLTIRTPPRRQPGTYQAPEVQQASSKNMESSNDAHQGNVGRKGDIWSFACIFSEVLTFALGQTPALKTFRSRRKDLQKNDHFYEKEEDPLLNVQNRPASYRVRSKVTSWLLDLSKVYSFSNRAIDCCAQTILDILVVDGKRRPRAKDLVEMMSHVTNHVKNARRPGKLPQCPLNRHSDETTGNPWVSRSSVRSPR
jgi:serine/threonine protein kinase